MGEMTGFQLGVFGALFLSVASSVSIVICNKALMSNLGFPFGNQYFSFVFSTDLFSFYYSLISFLNFYCTFILTFTVTLFLSVATTLTSWHLMVTFCTLHVANRLNFFESKSIDMKTVMLFGILNGISIGLLNLSLGFNSVGFYQVYIDFISLSSHFGLNALISTTNVIKKEWYIRIFHQSNMFVHFSNVIVLIKRDHI